MRQIRLCYTQITFLQSVTLCIYTDSSTLRYSNCYNFVKKKKNRTTINLDSLYNLKPLLSKSFIHFILNCFHMTQRLDELRHFLLENAELPYYVRTLNNFFLATESTMNLKIEASSLQRFLKIWRMIFFFTILLNFEHYSCMTKIVTFSSLCSFSIFNKSATKNRTVSFKGLYFIFADSRIHFHLS